MQRQQKLYVPCRERDVNPGWSLNATDGKYWLLAEVGWVCKARHPLRARYADLARQKRGRWGLCKCVGCSSAACSGHETGGLDVIERRMGGRDCSRGKSGLRWRIDVRG